MPFGWNGVRFLWGATGFIVNIAVPVVGNIAGGAIAGAVTLENYKNLNRTDENLGKRVDSLRTIQLAESFQGNLEMGIIYDMVGRAIRNEDVARVYKEAVEEFVAGETLYHAGVRLPVARTVIGVAQNFTNFLWDEYESVSRILDILRDQEEIIRAGRNNWDFLVKARKYMWLLNKKNTGRWIETEESWSQHSEANNLLNRYLNMIKDYQRDLHYSNDCGRECRWC